MPDDVLLKCSLIKAFGGGSRWVLVTCGSLGPIPFIFMQFSATILPIWHALLRVGAPTPNREILDPLLASLGQDNIFTSVCHSFCPLGGRGRVASFPACITGHMTRGGLHPGGSASGEGLGRPPRALQNTVNKRTVRILLECILVVFKFVLVWYEVTDMSQCCVSVCRNQTTGHQGSCRSHSSMMIGILEIS